MPNINHRRELEQATQNTSTKPDFIQEFERDIDSQLNRNLGPGSKMGSFVPTIGFGAQDPNALLSRSKFMQATTPQQAQPQDQGLGYYGGGGGIYSPTGVPGPGQHAMPPRPELPTSLPQPTNVSQLNLPETPNYYSGLDANVGAFHQDMRMPSSEAQELQAAAQRVMNAALGRGTLSDADRQAFGITGDPDVRDVVRINNQVKQLNDQRTYLGSGYWDDAEAHLDETTRDRRTDYYDHLDPTLTDYYSDLDFRVADRYGDIPRMTGQHYAGLDPTLSDPYRGVDFNIGDHYGDIKPLGYEHYLRLDPTQPDYYSNLKDLIEDGSIDIEEISEEERMRLAQEYADLQIDPQKAQLRRWLQQSELDADAQTARIQAAYAGGESALARREDSQARTDLESAVSRGMGRTGAVDQRAGEREEHFTEQLMQHEGKQAAELTAIANQLGLTQRQIQERKADLEEMRGKLTSQELKELTDREQKRTEDFTRWRFDASLNIADRLTDSGRWEHEQAKYVADRMSQIDQFNSQMQMSIGDRKTEIEKWAKEMNLSKADREVAMEQWEKNYQREIADRLTDIDRMNLERDMSIADRRTALDQWLKEMDLSKADRQSALEQWEKTYDLEVAHRQSLDDQRFREWEQNARMAIGDRKYDLAVGEFNARMGVEDRNYQQAVDQFARELQISDRLTERDQAEMRKALDVYDRTQLSLAQQYQLWLTMAEIAGVFPDQLPS